MKSIRFAVVAILVAVAITGCKKSDIDKARISITEVTENSISCRCTYTPDEKNDGGYMIFFSPIEEVTDDMRQFMTEAYSMYTPVHESRSFVCDSLASDLTYYIMAVTYNNKKGQVEIDKIVTLAQRTLASNDSRVTYSVDGQIVTLSIAIDDNGYRSYIYDVFGDRSAHINIELIPHGVVSSIDETDNYQNGNIVCSVDFDEVQFKNKTLQSAYKKVSFYAYVPTGNENEYKKYEAYVDMEKTRFAKVSVGRE